ncbi:NAD-P-binding protein [Artomyces pyxidatus]|uniref:NAD-P-binding protein n=1 Tax=Artomyces pyxidatus TaxID=48021 RepID=A0ACB8SXU6_9AGAM|nr:NAD-P-binding protein [Artomyces pyxidatus]
MVFILKRLYSAFYPPVPNSTSPTPLRFGILGAANIAPIALVLPIKNHPDAVVHAVAARDQKRADAFAKKWGIRKAYGGSTAYQELLDDPQVDAIYNPLPNGLHYEWTMKALAAGKHVLLEKPSANTSEETRRMFEFAEKKGLVLLEAFHYRFHPAVRRAKEIVSSGELGEITRIETSMSVPVGIIKANDIRLQYNLGGGALMDMGCYAMSMARYLAGSNPVRVVTASADTESAFPKIDVGTTATLAFASPTSEFTANVRAVLRDPLRFGFIPRMPELTARVVGTQGELTLFNFVLPWAYHYITVQSTLKTGAKQTRTEKHYGKDSWTTYRYQLEAFVDKVRGRTPEHWYDAEDSIANLQWIEHIYEETGLGARPASTAQVPAE